MGRENPFITIGIICFNAADTIIRAIKSAENQNWSNFEIIVVDDGSEDASVEIIDNYMKDKSDVQIIKHRQNLGTAVSRTTLVKNANGEFLVFFDDDDESLPNRLEEQYYRIITYERTYDVKMVLCFSDRKIIISENTKENHVSYGIGRSYPEPNGKHVADRILWLIEKNTDNATGQMGSCTLMLRTSIFRKIGYFDFQFRRCAEWDFAIRASFEGAHFISVPKSLVIQYKTYTVDKAGKKPLTYQLMLCYKYKDYLKKNCVYWSALFLAHSKFYGNRGQKWKSRGFVALACLFSPHKILLNRVQNRLNLLKKLIQCYFLL